MHSTGRKSWQIREDRWIPHYEWALWIRAAERIDAPAGGLVPGPLLIDPLPTPSPGLDLATLSEQWLSWWQLLCGLPEWLPDEGGPPPAFAHSGPHFEALGRQPLLREVLRTRWLEASYWHTERKHTGVRDRAFMRRPQASAVVAEVERAIGRTAKPFVLTIDVLPVDDQDIRAINDARFLVSESVRDSASWADVLHGLVEPLA